MFHSQWDRRYVPAKLRSDPLYDAVFRQLDGSDLPLLDLGCGLGLLAFYLRRRGLTAPILSLDYDRRKVDEATRIAAEHGFPSLEFRHHDARNGLPDHSGNVTILDILQFFRPAELDELLPAAAGRVAPGGRLVIRSAIGDRSWRHRVTIAGDVFARATMWMKAAPVHYPGREDFERLLKPFGKLSITPLWGRTPFNNHLVVLRRDSRKP
jgi:2-polyprenyl-3-methyl-5-hydroxy-6-metoxy-1,4-benzoquinol methylase